VAAIHARWPAELLIDLEEDEPRGRIWSKSLALPAIPSAPGQQGFSMLGISAGLGKRSGACFPA
jgi:hypothetical protein